MATTTDKYLSRGNKVLEGLHTPPATTRTGLMMHLGELAEHRREGLVEFHTSEVGAGNLISMTTAELEENAFIVSLLDWVLSEAWTPSAPGIRWAT